MFLSNRKTEFINGQNLTTGMEYRGYIISFFLIIKMHESSKNINKINLHIFGPIYFSSRTTQDGYMKHASNALYVNGGDSYNTIARVPGTSSFKPLVKVGSGNV